MSTLSIIIPTLNEAKRLPKLLKQLSQQPYQDFEIIVSDGQSTDATLAKAKEFAGQLKLTLISSSRSNVSAQRNLGAKKAYGEWLLFMDADNQLPPEFLPRLMDQISHHQPDIFTTWYQPDNHKLSHRLSLQFMNFFTTLMQRTPSPFVTEALLGIRHTLFDQINGFNSQLPFNEGMDIIYRAKKTHHAKFIVFKSPRYYFCMRRVNHFGLLTTIIKNLIAGSFHLIHLTPSKKLAHYLYPMQGGSTYTKK